MYVYIYIICTIFLNFRHVVVFIVESQFILVEFQFCFVNLQEKSVFAFIQVAIRLLTLILAVTHIG